MQDVHKEELQGVSATDEKFTGEHVEEALPAEASAEEKMAQAAHQLDILSHSHGAEWEKRTTRKVDIRLLIILGLCYAVSLIDRTNTSVARVAGMQVSLRLDIGERYSIINLLFFVTYIIFELPSNIMLQKVGARYWLAFIVGAFGAVMTGMAFVKTWEQLAVCRIILGVFEAGFFPACTFLISCWYTRYQTQSRLAVFYLTSMVISGFSNIIGYGMSTLSGNAGLLGWQWIFLLFGVITLGLAILAFFFVVDFPNKSTFLSEDQKAWIIARINKDRGDALADKLTFRTFLRDISAPHIWAFAWMFMSTTTASYAFAFFLPIILAGNGYSTQLSLILSAPPYASAAIYTFVISVIADRTRKRGLFICISCTVCIVGLFIIAYAKQSGVRYFGAFLTIAGCQSNVPAVMAYAQNNVTRHSRRSVTSALVIGFGGIGGIVASTVYRQADYPGYIPGLWTTLALQLSIIGLIGLLTLRFRKINRMVDAGEYVAEETPGFKYTI